ncbi:hypothetical protein SAZ_02110 [Streptomyces noursei ZPM]|nr:hypothetical protein SAZ_02110 [Streptomyces noursei ZPM]
MLARPDGCTVVDARIRLAPHRPTGRPAHRPTDPYLRRLP